MLIFFDQNKKKYYKSSLSLGTYEECIYLYIIYIYIWYIDIYLYIIYLYIINQNGRRKEQLYVNKHRQNHILKRMQFVVSCCRLFQMYFLQFMYILLFYIILPEIKENSTTDYFTMKKYFILVHISNIFISIWIDIYMHIRAYIITYIAPVM